MLVQITQLLVSVMIASRSLARRNSDDPSNLSTSSVLTVLNDSSAGANFLDRDARFVEQIRNSRDLKLDAAKTSSRQSSLESQSELQNQI